MNFKTEIQSAKRNYNLQMADVEYYWINCGILDENCRSISFYFADYNPTKLSNHKM